MQEVKSVLGKTEFLRRALLLKQRADLSRAHRFMTYEKIIAASQSLHSWINLFCVPGVKPCCRGPLMVLKGGAKTARFRLWLNSGAAQRLRRGLFHTENHAKLL